MGFNCRKKGRKCWGFFCFLPIVLRIVAAKKMDCPKLQLGSLVTLPIAETPRLFALIISTMNVSNSSSVNKKTKISRNDLFHYVHPLSRLPNEQASWLPMYISFHIMDLKTKTSLLATEKVETPGSWMGAATSEI